PNMYKVPKNGEVVLAIQNVLARYKVIHSQRELREKVELELNFGGGNFHVSGFRIRRLAVISGIAKLKVSTRATGKKGTISDCPVCGEKLEASRNMTIYGKTITTGFKCNKCAFWTEKNNLRRPSRYEFSMRKRR
ncbi:MAG: hypothetical protein Q7J68_06965, partial [Thermoplasmata archaeon]|nr:hypothetical protein [Thermoplasmata archaeon]